MFGGFGFNGVEIESWEIEVWVGEALVQNQMVQLPSVLVEHEFANYVGALGAEKRPMKVKFSYVTDSTWADEISFTNAIWDKAESENNT